MGQIVKRKKKGRPSKADLARRSASGLIPAATAAQLDRRRSLRRRNVRYNNFIDFDDYLDEEFEEGEDDEEEEERRKEKKLKLVLKLNNQTPNRNSRSARGTHSRENGAASSGSSSEEDEESERKPLKKRKISGAGGDSEAEDESENDRRNDDEEAVVEEGRVEEEEEEEEEEEDDNNNNNNNGNQEERERKAGGNQRQDSIPGTPSRHPNGFPLPEKRTLELILDKLQKKDTYGVYAEPVDLDELPDYLDVIDHPMDFATVRKKLGNGSYSTMEQFENDVFLICSNAMQYNAPETIYHKQARSIQELARKKFQKLRFDIERSEKDLKSELKTKTNLLTKKPMKKPLSRTMQESLGSEFSSGATLATAGDIQNGSIPNHAVVCERPSNVEGPIEGGNSSVIENNLEKAEELSSGKDLLSKLGRKTSGLDENRRATYNLSDQPLAASESIFSTFESEIKQLVAVGLHSEYSYARSLARFAATLGPIAWKVASQRIQQALPPGFKFGRGWVGEYEPLSTPVLMLETHTQKESILSTKSPRTANAPKSEASLRNQVATKEHPTRGPISERKPSLLHPTSVSMSERKTSSASALARQSSPPNASTNQQNLRPRMFSDSRNKVAKQVELNLPPSSYQHDADIVAEKQLPSNSAMPASKLREISKTMALPQSVSSRKPDKEVALGGLSNGNITSSSSNSRIQSPSSKGAPDQMVQAAKYFPKGQEQVLTDPVEAMRISAEKAQKQQKPLTRSSADTSPVVPSVTSLGNESGNAAVAAARAWMSLGAAGSKLQTENPSTTKNQISAESLYNPTRQFHGQVPLFQGHFPFPAGMQFIPEKHSFPFQAFMRPPVLSGNEGPFQNRPIILPQFVGNDLSRFQVQSPWRAVSPPSQPKQKHESHAPDLNISFQSPGSPAKQSSGVMVDSQQPDLALQL